VEEVEAGQVMGTVNTRQIVLLVGVNDGDDDDDDDDDGDDDGIPGGEHRWKPGYPIQARPTDT